MQENPDIEKTDPMEEISFLEWTIYTSMRKVGVTFNTDTDKLKNVVDCHSNSLYLKDKVVDFKLTEY